MSDEHQDQEIKPVDIYIKPLDQIHGEATTQDAVRLARYIEEAEAIRSMPSPTQKDKDRLDWLLSEIAKLESKK